MIVDSYFWSQPLMWPEFSGIYFNVYEGKSAEWGVSYSFLLYSLPAPVSEMFLLIAFPEACLFHGTSSKAPHGLCSFGSAGSYCEREGEEHVLCCYCFRRPTFPTRAQGMAFYRLCRPHVQHISCEGCSLDVGILIFFC